MRPYALCFLMFLIAAARLFSQEDDHPAAGRVSGYPYAPAFYSSGGGGLHQQALVIFPFDSPSRRVALPDLSVRAFSPDGTALYAHILGHAPGPRLIRVTGNNPLAGQQAPGSTGIENLNSLAVSANQERIVFSGGYRAGSRITCGIFEFVLSSRTVRVVIPRETCDFLSGWQKLSLSPDSSMAVAVRRRTLFLIDLGSGEAEPIGTYIEGSWSPDGRWIAALEANGQTKLLDPVTLVAKKDIGLSDLTWSPDSRFLLHQTSRARGPFSYWSSLETVDVETGQRKFVESSRCMLNQSTLGWVRLSSFSGN